MSLNDKAQKPITPITDLSFTCDHPGFPPIIILQLMATLFGNSGKSKSFLPSVRTTAALQATLKLPEIKGSSPCVVQKMVGGGTRRCKCSLEQGTSTPMILQNAAGQHCDPGKAKVVRKMT